MHAAIRPFTVRGHCAAPMLHTTVHVHSTPHSAKPLCTFERTFHRFGHVDIRTCVSRPRLVALFRGERERRSSPPGVCASVSVLSVYHCRPRGLTRTSINGPIRTPGRYVPGQLSGCSAACLALSERLPDRSSDRPAVSLLLYPAQIHFIPLSHPPTLPRPLLEARYPV